MKLLSCQICGGELKQNGEHYECAYCRHQFQDDTLERAYHDLKNSLESVTRSAVDEAFVLAKERELANLRRELWARTHERYVNSRAITRICRDIKKINPDDFGARFYEVMNDESEETRLVTEFLDGIDVFEKEDYVDDVVDFVVKSLKIEYLPSLNMLVERAYKTDKAKYEAVMTKIEDEAEKVEGGLYETQLSRDVFVAYSSKDIAIVNELVSYLETQGVSCFVALRNLQHGRKAVENYEKALETAMDNCRIFLFVSSKNSRSLTCDAVKREIPYIKKKDLEFKPEYRNNYEKMPERYRKPRIQYRIDDVKTAIVDRQISEFFGTLQWRCDLDSVAEQIGEYLNQEFDDEPIERKEEPQAPQPQQPAFDQEGLYAFFRKMREEEETARREEEKKKEEARQAEEKRKAEEAEKLRQAEEKRKAEELEKRRQETTSTPPTPQPTVTTTPEPKGSSNEIFNIGWNYYSQKDYKNAVIYFEKAANLGHVVAQNNLGLCYKNGYGVTQNYQKAVELYTKSANQGYALAQNNLGVCYQHGLGVPQNYQKAVELFTKSANQGNALGQNNLGLCYKNGWGIAQNYEKAVEWYTKSANQNYALAQNNLGVCYRDGFGVPQNHQKAVELFIKSANQGNVEGQTNLGYSYSKGLGIAQSYQKAIEWYTKAANQGHALAQNNLGWCYQNGLGVQQNYQKAIELYTKAANQGNTLAKNNLNALNKILNR